MIKSIPSKGSGSQISVNSKIVLRSNFILSSKKQKNLQAKLKEPMNKFTIANNVNSYQKRKTIQFFLSRKQSLLNSYFNKRKGNLVNITKQNKKIYDRINSQKSNYSSRVLNKSYDSINSKASRISNRSFSSKRSDTNKSTKGLSLKNSRSSKIKLERNNVIKPLITAQKINTINKQQILIFNDIFCSKNQTKIIKSKANKNQILGKHDLHNENSMTQIKQFPTQIGTNRKQKRSNIIFHEMDRKNNRKIEIYRQMPLPSLKTKIPQRSQSLQRIFKDLGNNHN